MTTQVLEGTWEEIARQGKDLVGRRVRLFVLEEENATEPNRKAIDVLTKLRRKQHNLRFTSGETGIDIVRRGRSGDMFQDESE